jgi:hypothetical protein
VPWIPIIGVAALVCFAIAGVAAFLAFRGRGGRSSADVLGDVAAELELETGPDGTATGRLGRAQVELRCAPEGRRTRLTVNVALPRPLGLGLSMRRRSDDHCLELARDGVDVETPHPDLRGWEIRAHNHPEVAQLLGPRVRQALGNLRTGKDTEVVLDDAGCRALSLGWRRDPVWLKQHVLAVVRVAGVLDSETAKVALADTMDVLSETHPSMDDA